MAPRRARTADPAAAGLARRAAAALAGAAASWCASRVYGHLLPNSVLYKSGTGELTTVAEAFLDQSALVRRRSPWPARSSPGGRSRLLLVPFLVYLLGSLGTLDSANGWSRFFQPVWPQLALLAGVLLARAVRDAGGRRRRLDRGGRRSTSLRRPARQPRGGRRLAGALHELPGRAPGPTSPRWLVRETPPSTTFSVSDAGLLPARAGGRTAYDAFLLNDPLLQQTGPLPPARARRRSCTTGVPTSSSWSAATPTGSSPATRRTPRSPSTRRSPAYRLAHTGSGGPGCGYHLLAYRR